jgi:hypothetical protein
VTTIRLDKDTVGPNETVRGRLDDGSLDFTAIPAHMSGAFRVVLTAIGGSSAALNFIIPNPRFVDRTTVEFTIPRVGQLTPRGDTVPEGSYRVTFAYGFWSAVGVPGLRVLANPSAAPARNPNTYTYSFPSGSWAARVSRAVLAIAAPLQYVYTGLLRTRLFGLLTGRLTLQMLTQRDLAGQLQKTFFQTVSSPSPGASGSTSVRPLLDATENYPEWETLIEDAQQFVYVVSLGFDEKTNLKSTDQLERPGRPESEWRTIEQVLKARARRPGNRVEIKVLIWESTGLADWNEYEDWFTDIGDLGVVELRWRDVRGADVDEFLRRIRPHTGAPDDLLRVFYSAYRNAAPDEVLPFPSGIEIALEDHPVRSVVGSHHQKFILTDRGAWIGGMNTLRHQWDTADHVYRDARRSHSGEGAYPFQAPRPAAGRHMV